MYFSNFPTTQFGTVDLLDITRKARLDKIVKENALAYMNYTVEEGERPEDVAFYYYDDPSYAWLVLLANNIIDPYTHWPKDMRTFEEYLKVQYEEKSGTTGDAVIEWTKNATIGSNIEYYQSRQDPEVQINRASYVNLYNDYELTGEELLSITAGSVYKIVSLGDYPNNGAVWQGLTGHPPGTGIFDTYVQVGILFQASNAGSTIANIETSGIVLSQSSGETNEAQLEFYPVRTYDYEFELNERRREIVLVNKSLLPQIKDQLGTILHGS